MIKSYNSFVNEKLVKNKWTDINPLDYSDELISLVQNAYKKTDLGSFVKTEEDLLKSDWKAIDIDEYPDIESTIFYRESRPNETFSNYKIQGIGHDNTKESITVLLNKLKYLLENGDYWIEASGALENVLYKMNIPYIDDEETLKKLFPHSNLKMLKDRGKYNRTISNNKDITETVFGNVKFKK